MRRLVVKSAVGLCIVAFGFCLARLPSAGASDTRAGCLQESLFNGIWRVQVTGVEPYMNGDRQTGWQVTEVWRNGTAQQLHPADSFLKDQTLTLGNGTMLASGSTTGTLAMQSLANNGFAPAGQFTYKQIFVADSVDPTDKPKGVDITFDSARLAQIRTRPQFSTGQYNYHVDLSCTASGTTAQAQGGSTQVNAREGCLNQWMSNGIWQMRVTGITPAHLSPEDPSTAQTGWLVAQEWTNATKRPLFPGVLPSGPAIETNVSDEYLVTQGGNNASSSNAVGGMSRLTSHEFAPGASFTYQQLFVWSPFDANDKPTRLLVTFDAKKQNALAAHPHYAAPANFRISLDCQK